MSISNLQSIATIAAFIAFIGIAWWAFSPKNKKRFEQDAQLAFDDDEPSESKERTKDEQ